MTRFELLLRRMRVVYPRGYPFLRLLFSDLKSSNYQVGTMSGRFLGN
jgi:hypothetical protein